MNYTIQNVIGEQKNILVNTHFTSKNMKVVKSIATAGVIKAGTVIKKDGTKIEANAADASGAIGIVLYDVNVANEVGTNVNAPVLTHGTVKESATGFTYAEAVKAALPQILFL